MKNNDKGMRELLKLLKAHPELISALVLDPRSVRRLLKGKAARKMTLGIDTRALLEYVAGPGGGPIAMCLVRTARFCLPIPKTFPCRTATKIPCHWIPLTVPLVVARAARKRRRRSPRARGTRSL
jgi:hypothetical protein